jgi:hypothetical protein
MLRLLKLKTLMAKSNTRLEKYKSYRLSIDRMIDPTVSFSQKQNVFFNSDQTGWLMTLVLGLLATVSIVVIALVFLGAIV